MSSACGNVTVKQLQETAKALTIADTAIVGLLIDKGIVTEDEWKRALVRAAHHVDQAVAEIYEEQLGQLEAEDPRLADVIKRLEEVDNKLCES